MSDEREQGQLIVAELIEQLEKMPKDSLVWLEDCGCYGAVRNVEYVSSDNSVVITMAF